MEKKTLGTGSRIKHPKYGVGVVTGQLVNGYQVTFIQYGMLSVEEEDDFTVIDAVAPQSDFVSLADVEKVVTKILNKWGGIEEMVELGQKWDNGTLILKPADDSLKAKEMPIDTFFHKIVMTRDRLRVMEQRINNSKNLSDEEKVNLQQYIHRIYGSLTSFNVLFKHKKDHFKSK